MSLKTTLAKFAVRKVIGVYISDREVHVSKVIGTLFGPLEVVKVNEAYTPDQLGAVLKRLLTPLLGRRNRFPLPLALGLSGQRVFFSSRPVKSSTGDLSPQMLLHEVLQSASISVDDMALDVARAQPGKRPIVSIASCRRKYLQGLLAALRTVNVNPLRAEPGPCALLRLGIQECRAPRRSKTVVRMFLGAEQGLAVLTVGNVPFAWRYFPLRPNTEGTGILSAVRTLQTLSRPCGIESPIDTIMVHGRQDLRQLIESEQLREGIGIRTQWVAGPALDDSAIAYALAQGCLNEPPQAFDLSRALKPRRSLWELFPWGEVAVQAALILCMGLFLLNRSEATDKSYKRVRNEFVERKWLQTVTEQQLQKEKQELQQKVDAVKKFLGTRVVWAAYTRDIPARLPANMTVKQFEGQCDMELMGKKKEAGLKQKKQLLIGLTAPIANNGAMPKEIAELLEQFREHPLLKRDFPDVEVGRLAWFQPTEGSKPTADFTVICQPKPSSGAPKSEPEKHD